MEDSLSKFLAEIARRDSRLGGGSVAALSVALAAALLEKLITEPRSKKSLQAIRSRSYKAVREDAGAFARVVQALRAPKRAVFVRSLKAATQVQWQVFADAYSVLKIAQAGKTSIKPKFQSDLRCVQALAKAAGQGSQALIETNVSWLQDKAYARAARKRLQTIQSQLAAPRKRSAKQVKP